MVEEGGGKAASHSASSDSSTRWRDVPTTDQAMPPVVASYDQIDTIFADDAYSADSLSESASAVATNPVEGAAEFGAHPPMDGKPTADSQGPIDSAGGWSRASLHLGVALAGVMIGLVAVVTLSRSSGVTSISQNERQIEKPAITNAEVRKVVTPRNVVHEPNSEDAPPVTERAEEAAEVQPQSAPVAVAEAISVPPPPKAAGSPDQPPSKTVVAAKTPPRSDDAPLVRTRPTVRLPAVDLPEPLRVDVQRRLRDPIVSISFTGAKLSDVLTFVSEFSTIPITLSAQAMMQANLKLSTPVSVDLKEATIGDVLRSAIASLGMEFSIQGSHLVIHRALPPDGLMRVEEYHVGDLIGGMHDHAEQLLQVVQESVSPHSWEASGGDGQIHLHEDTLVVQQDEPNHFEIIRLCEKLRVARGLDTRSRYPHALFQLTPRHQQAEHLLKTPVRVRHWSPTGFGQIVADLAAAADGQILVDWRALEVEGWNHHLKLRFVVDNKRLSTAIEELLEPLNLTYRIESADMLVITTETSELQQMDIEMYRVGPLEGPQPEESQQLTGQIREAVGMDHFAVAGGEGLVMYDPISQCLIVRLPQSQQRLVADFLAGLES